LLTALFVCSCNNTLVSQASDGVDLAVLWRPRWHDITQWTRLSAALCRFIDN